MHIAAQLLSWSCVFINTPFRSTIITVVSAFVIMSLVSRLLPCAFGWPRRVYSQFSTELSLLFGNLGALSFRSSPTWQNMRSKRFTPRKLIHFRSEPGYDSGFPFKGDPTVRECYCEASVTGRSKDQWLSHVGYIHWMPWVPIIIN